jgi:DNA-directed RNA polymerase subunit RPC12/RpoP
MQVRCANCGAQITLARDDAFLRCSFCDSTLYLDRAQTFRRFTLPPAVPRARAGDVLAGELAAQELPRLQLLKCEGALLPFWGVRGVDMQETIPAFVPVPQGLHEFRLPSAGAVPDAEGDPEGFQREPCSQGASATWEGRPDVSSFGLYFVPFYKLSYGEGGPTYTAWVDAVAARVYLGQTPPPLTDHITRRFWRTLSLAFLVFAFEALVIPNSWAALAVVAVTASGFYPTLRGRFGGGEG